MDTKKQQGVSSEDLNLATERSGDYASEYCIDAMLDNGVLINVTAWATRQMEYREGRFRVTVALTAKLCRVIHAIPKELTFFQTVRGRVGRLSHRLLRRCRPKH